MKKQKTNIRLNESYYSCGLETWLSEEYTDAQNRDRTWRLHEVMWFKGDKDENSHAESLYCLGVAYTLGKGVKKDKAEAFKCFRLSAEQGCDKSQYNVGVCYETGYGCHRDYAQAAQWYRVAIKNNVDNARNNLACLYMKGQGVEKNPAKAKRLWNDIKGFYFPEVDYNRGVMYSNGDSVKPNIQKAIDYYLDAIKDDFLNETNAKYMLGFFYHYGIGVPQNYKRAAMFYRELAAKGHEAAAFKLSLIENKIPPYDTLRFEIRMQDNPYIYYSGIRIFQ